MRRHVTMIYAVVLLLFAPALQALDTSHGLLWRIEAPERPASYLFGTIHSDDERVTRLPAPVREAFTTANQLVVEVTFGLDTIATLQQAMLLPQGKSLRTLLGDEALYRECVRLMGERGLPESATNRYHPWAVLLTLSVPPSEGGAVLDMLLYQRALLDGKDVAGLETPEEQLALFSGLSLADQITLLRDTLAQQEAMEPMYERLKQAYLARDLATLERISEESMGEVEEPLAEAFSTSLVEERNRRMAQRLEPYLKRGGVFVAIGALHLPGEEGVVELLARRGYRVEKVY